ncbi:MAG: LysM peptidoglycan-binding domain-containing protein [Myxococcaceae bacterium]
MKRLLLLSVIFAATVAGAASDVSDAGMTADPQVAQGAINAARNAIEQSGAKDKRQVATAKLKEAEALYASQKYADAAKAADAAWQLVSNGAQGPTHFEVEVSENGKTKVTSKLGQPVRVEAEGVVRPVYVGQVVTVAKGEKPKAEIVTPPPGTPELVTPAPDEKLRFKASEKLLGPVKLSWRPVRNARGYEVEVRPVEIDGQMEPLSLTVDKTVAKLPKLAAGRYVWTVRAVSSDGTRGEVTQARGFELARDGVKIEVTGTTWK